MRHLATLLALVGCMLALPTARTGADLMAQQNPPVYFVLLHTPGPTWDPSLGFREQPGVDQHIQYMAGIMDGGQLVMGGPFLDDSGGMMIMRAENLEAAQEVATADPGVQSGLLQVEVKPWMVAMSSQ